MFGFEVVAAEAWLMVVVVLERVVLALMGLGTCAI